VEVEESKAVSAAGIEVPFTWIDVWFRTPLKLSGHCVRADSTAYMRDSDLYLLAVASKHSANRMPAS